MIINRLIWLTKDGQLILRLEADSPGFWHPNRSTMSPMLVLGDSIDRICIKLFKFIILSKSECSLHAAINYYHQEKVKTLAVKPVNQEN